MLAGSSQVAVEDQVREGLLAAASDEVISRRETARPPVDVVNEKSVPALRSVTHLPAVVDQTLAVLHPLGVNQREAA